MSEIPTYQNNKNMNIGLTILYALLLISLLIASNQHGKEKTGKHNFWINLLSTIITLVIVWWALGWKFI